MSIVSKLWEKFAKSKKYREEFVAAQVKRGIPFQARALLRARKGWTQQTLAEKSGLTQGVVSRALNPNYGNLTLNTIVRVAAGFDVAFVGKFVPFSELERWFEDMSENSVQVPTFEEENAKRQAQTLTSSRVAPSSFVDAVKEGLSRNQVVILSLQSQAEGSARIHAAMAGNEPERSSEPLAGPMVPSSLRGAASQATIQ